MRRKTKKRRGGACPRPLVRELEFPNHDDLVRVTRKHVAEVFRPPYYGVHQLVEFDLEADAIDRSVRRFCRKGKNLFWSGDQQKAGIHLDELHKIIC